MRTKIGNVTSNKMQKTVVVSVEESLIHPIYKKRFFQTEKFFAHTNDQIAEGSRVRIEETRPLSKKKRWKVVEIYNS